MRGTHFPAHIAFRSHRNTPAYAGNTSADASAEGDAEEHPRVCGEHKIPKKEDEKYEGTPPRMRGTLRRRAEELGLKRNTPAYAGNTLAC